MPKIARAVALGFPHHIVQRGNNREKDFINEEDKNIYHSSKNIQINGIHIYLPTAL